MLNQVFLGDAYGRDDGRWLPSCVAVHAGGGDAWVLSFDLVELDAVSIGYEVLPFYFLLLVE